jgi:hypothetical protein
MLLGVFIPKVIKYSDNLSSMLSPQIAVATLKRQNSRMTQRLLPMRSTSTTAIPESSSILPRKVEL